MTKREYGESLIGKVGVPTEYQGHDFISYAIPGTSLTYAHLASDSDEPLTQGYALDQAQYYERHLRLEDPLRRDKEQWYKVLKLRDDLKGILPTLPRT